jgi:hypothetical protein
MTRSKLSLIITGPVSGFSNYQIKLLKNVASQGGDIVISTWESSKDSLPNNLPSETKVLLAHDWESPLGYTINGKDKQINFDKQAYLIKIALREIGTDYTLRLRSDISIDPESIWRYKEIMDSGLIITTDISSVNASLIGSSKLNLHPCDWLFAGQTQVLKHFVNECDYYVELIKSNCKLNSPYNVEDRVYTSTGAAEQYFGASLAGIKSSASFFTPPRKEHRLISPISNGFYVIESSKLNLISSKQRLRFKYPFRIREEDNRRYKRIRLKLSFLVELLVHKCRCALKIN